MPVDVTSPHCGCGCRPQGCQPGCPCKECQPGPGLNYQAIQRGKSRAMSNRMQSLLRRENLTAAEERELEDLLHIMINR